MAENGERVVPETARIKSQPATRSRLADLGISRSQSSRWQHVAGIDGPVRHEYLEQAFEGGEVTTAGLLAYAAQASREQRRDEIARTSVALPSGRYRCLVIDPPWPMETIARASRPHQGLGTLDYPTKTLERLADPGRTADALRSAGGPTDAPDN